MTAPDPAATFRQEAQELLVQLEEALLDIENRPAEREPLDTAFRALHTLKGSGAMFGFDSLAQFAHHLENAFDLVRKGKAVASPELISVTLDAKDHLRALLEAPPNAGDTSGGHLLERLRALVGTTGSLPMPDIAAGAGIPSGHHGDTWRIRIGLPQECLQRGTNPLLLLDELRAVGDCSVVAITDRVPPLDAIDPNRLYLTWDAVLTTEAPRSAIEDVFVFELDDMDLVVERLAPGAGERKLGEILIERGDVPSPVVETALEKQPRIGSLLVEGAGLSPDKVKSALVEQQHLRREGGSSATMQGAESIRVPAERLDELMDRVGELVIAQARLKQLAMALDHSGLRTISEEVERLANELRDTTMVIRMVPIASLFGRFRRLVRDLSRDLRKGVDLTTEGDETELDKTVIERLADPLVHLIRNAIDHGLEPAEQRVAAGKAEHGTIHLSAVHSGAEVLISVSDDGRGLDTARIRARAEEQGLLPAGTRLSDAELFQYVFQPGFSTAREVTSLSGRGVGMDVVKRAIDALRGKIDIQSQPGCGTTVTLRLPLTLAIIDGLLVRVGAARYVIPLAAVEECVELLHEDDLRHTGRNFLNIRGALVPFIRLRELFSSTQPADPFQKVVIVAAGEHRVGLVVDQVIGEHQTVIKSLSKLHADIESFSGATILGDGTVALILDVSRLVAEGRAIEPAREAS